MTSQTSQHGTGSLAQLARIRLEEWCRTAADRLPPEVRRQQHEETLADLKRLLDSATYEKVAAVPDSGSKWMGDLERVLGLEVYLTMCEAIVEGGPKRTPPKGQKDATP